MQLMFHIAIEREIVSQQSLEKFSESSELLPIHKEGQSDGISRWHTRSKQKILKEILESTYLIHSLHSQMAGRVRVLLWRHRHMDSFPTDKWKPQSLENIIKQPCHSADHVQWHGSNALTVTSELSPIRLRKTSVKYTLKCKDLHDKPPTPEEMMTEILYTKVQFLK